MMDGLTIFMCPSIDYRLALLSASLGELTNAD